MTENSSSLACRVLAYVPANITTAVGSNETFRRGPPIRRPADVHKMWMPSDDNRSLPIRFSGHSAAYRKLWFRLWVPRLTVNGIVFSILFFAPEKPMVSTFSPDNNALGLGRLGNVLMVLLVAPVSIKKSYFSPFTRHVMIGCSVGGTSESSSQYCPAPPRSSLSDIRSAPARLWFGAGGR